MRELGRIPRAKQARKEAAGLTQERVATLRPVNEIVRGRVVHHADEGQKRRENDVSAQRKKKATSSARAQPLPPSPPSFFLLLSSALEARLAMYSRVKLADKSRNLDSNSGESDLIDSRALTFDGFPSSGHLDLWKEREVATEASVVGRRTSAEMNCDAADKEICIRGRGGASG